MSSILISASRRILPVVCLLLAASCAPKIEKMPVREKPVRPETREALRGALEQARSKVADIGRHDWAGEYGFGGGLGRWVKLILTPDGDAVYTWSADIGMCDWDVGHIVEVWPDRILIEWGDPANWRFKEMADVFFRVRWDGRHYLVPEHRMIEFCNDVNAGFGTHQTMSDLAERSFLHLLREADMIAGLKGQPDVPPAYREYLLPGPISAEITRVSAHKSDSDSREWYDAEINAGADAGLRPQMTMFSQSDQWLCWVSDADVISVERNTSRVRIPQNHWVTDCVPCVGDTLSTRRRWFDEQKTASAQAD